MAVERDFVPVEDPEFDDMVANFVAVLTPIVTSLGLTLPEITALGAQRTTFAADLFDHQTQKTIARAAKQKKDTSRKPTEATLRKLVKRIQPHPFMTDALRAQLRITIPDLIRTARVVGTDVPQLTFEAKPGQVIVHWGTNPGNEQLNGKPAWANGCTIYRRKASETTAVQIGHDAASPFFDNSVGGAATDYFYSAAYFGVKDSDVGPRCPEQKIAAGG